MRSPLLSLRWLGIHLAALLVLAVCVAGTAWQVTRSFEPDRETITNPAEDLSHAEPIDANFEPGEYLHPDRIANSAVEATGNYDTDSQLLVPRTRNGVEGFDVILPLVVDEGVALTVSRGWTEDEDHDLPAPPEGEITTTGWLLPTETAAEGIRPMEMPEGQVERIAPSVLLQEWEHHLYEGYIVLPENDPAAAGLTPIPPPEPPTGVTVNWRSLSYSFQWGIFGVSALVFWIILMRRELAEARSSAQEGPGPSGQEGTPEKSEKDGDQPVGAGS